jgi:hypothetical protein
MFATRHDNNMVQLSLDFPFLVELEGTGAERARPEVITTFEASTLHKNFHLSRGFPGRVLNFLLPLCFSNLVALKP